MTRNEPDLLSDNIRSMRKMNFYSLTVSKKRTCSLIIISFMLGILPISANDLRFPAVARSSPISQGQTSYVYLPLIVRSIREIDVACRWSHQPATTTYVTYRWGDRLQTPGTLYRNAFQSSVMDWNSILTKMRLSFSSTGDIELNTYSSQDGRAGVTRLYCDGQLLTSAEVLANIYYESGRTNNSRRAITGHELGHGLGLGHIPEEEGIALMGYNPDSNVYYTPQNLDIGLMNQVYP